jgi:tubulin polyglutamylase TTLL9
MLPQGDYALFAEEFKRKPNCTWIMKPTSKSQGRGIFIFQKLSQISKWKSETRWVSYWLVWVSRLVG